jgi:hypothetical protein
MDDKKLEQEYIEQGKKRLELFDRVKVLMGWDDIKTDYWFTTPNPNLGGTTPDRMIVIGRAHKLEKFIANAEYENKPPGDSL